MVIDSLSNKSLYEKLHRRFPRAFAFLESCENGTPAAGQYEIDGEYVYAVVQEYETLPADQLIWEAHRRYIDIQYILQGSENMGWAALDDVHEDHVYNEEKDCILCGNVAEDGHFIQLKQGQFAILFPTDVHMPKCQQNERAAVKKIVVKVMV